MADDEIRRAAEAFLASSRAISSGTRADRIRWELPDDDLDAFQEVMACGDIDDLTRLFATFASLELSDEDESAITCGPVEDVLEHPELAPALRARAEKHGFAHLLSRWDAVRQEDRHET